jgi:hypothetical protein
MTPAEIYRQLTEGVGAKSMMNDQHDTLAEHAAETERAELVRSLAETIRSGWQGEASSGAYGAAMPLAESMLNNCAKLNDSQDLLLRQVGSFYTAFNSVRPVSEPPESSIDEKFPFDEDYEKSVTEYQDSAHHNIAVYREYDGASYYNETHFPQEYNSIDEDED